MIAALAVILGMMLLRGGVFSQAGRAFLEGTTVNGTDVSGLDAQSAAAALAEQTETYFLYPEAGGGQLHCHRGGAGDAL